MSLVNSRAVFAAAGLLLVLSSAALAQTRVVVRDFDGPQSGRVRAAVVDELAEHDVEVVASPEGADLDSAVGRVSAARAHGLSGFVQGRTERKGSRIRVELLLYSGRDGTQLAAVQLAAPRAKIAKLAGARAWKSFGASLADAATAPAPDAERLAPTASEPAPAQAELDDVAGEPTEEPVAQEEPAAEADVPEDTADVAAEPRAARRSPLDFSFGLRFSTRRFAYEDPFPGLRGYKLGLAPKLSLQLHWYPAAHFTRGFAANLGLQLRGELLVGVSSKNSAGDEFDTTSRELGAGLRLRVPLGAHELGVLVGYGQHSFAVDGASGVPGVAYGFVRVGGDASVAILGPLSAQARAAFLLGLSQGEIAEDAWFPHAAQHGLEFEAGLAYRVLRPLSLCALFGMQRYFMSFSPQVSDPGVQSDGRVAGGALDQYLSGRVAAVLRL